MKHAYEVTVKMRVKSHFDAAETKWRIEAALEHGTAREAIAEGADLEEYPNYVRVTLCRAKGDPYRQDPHAFQR